MRRFFDTFVGRSRRWFVPAADPPHPSAKCNGSKDASRNPPPERNSSRVVRFAGHRIVARLWVQFGIEAGQLLFFLLEIGLQAAVLDLQIVVGRLEPLFLARGRDFE